MFSVVFWKSAAERAVKSAAQALILMWGGGQVFNLFDVAPVASLGVAAGAAVLSVLTSLVSLVVGDDNSPSVLRDGS